MQRCPGRLTDERGKGCASSCSPPRLDRPPSRRAKGSIDICRGELLWQFLCKCLDTAVSSPWLLTFSRWASLFSFTLSGLVGFLELCTLPSWHHSGCTHFLMFPLQFSFQKNENNCRSKWASPPSLLSFVIHRETPFPEERSSAELRLCIAMCLLPLWWGGKPGWQLLIKTWVRSLQRGFSSAVFHRPPYLRTVVFFPATVLSVHLVSSEAGKRITFSYRVVRSHQNSCLCKPVPVMMAG